MAFLQFLAVFIVRRLNRVQSLSLDSFVLDQFNCELALLVDRVDVVAFLDLRNAVVFENRVQLFHRLLVHARALVEPH